MAYIGILRWSCRLELSDVPALDACLPGGLFPLWGTPVLPGGPPPGTPGAFPRCRIVAHRDQLDSPISAPGGFNEVGRDALRK
jgi:hypothetical protein